MSELERSLSELGAGIEWPPTPIPATALGARRRSRRLPVIVLAAIAALGIAFAVPGARSAILRALHLEGVTIERVGVLPPAQERSLGSGLGPRVDERAAEQALGRPPALPPVASTPPFHLEGGVVSVLLADPAPVLLSELRTGMGPEILKKLLGDSTGVVAVRVGGHPGFWISGAEHVYLAPSAPPRLAGNVLIWVSGGIVYRLEGRALTEAHALRLAAEIEGT